MNWKIIIAIIVLLALGIGGVLLLRKPAPAPIDNQNQGTTFPTGSNNTVAADTADIFAGKFYAWYLHGMASTPNFSDSQTFSSQISQWLTPSFAANWFTIAGDSGVDPALQSQDFQPTWVSNIKTSILSESTNETSVLVSLGTAGNLQRTKVAVVRDGTEWRIASIEIAE